MNPSHSEHAVQMLVLSAKGLIAPPPDLHVLAALEYVSVLVELSQAH